MTTYNGEKHIWILKHNRKLTTSSFLVAALARNCLPGPSQDGGSVSRWWSASMSADPAQTPPNLRAENRLPTQADGAARSEFERAARSGTLRAPPTTTPPKPAEATLGFSSTRKTIDNSPGWLYSSDQKKRLFKFPIRLGRRGGVSRLRSSRART
jgi:hypothetical protein